DQEIGQELLECNRRLEQLREEVAIFLGQTAENYVYWVERSGKTQRIISLNAAPIDVAEYLRRRLFRNDTSIVMASATLSTSVAQEHPRAEKAPAKSRPPLKSRNPPNHSGLNYFAQRVGAESATMLQVGTPFDYERQMKHYIVQQMPEPKTEGYREAL